MENIQHITRQARAIALHRGVQSSENERTYNDGTIHIAVDTATDRVWVSVYNPNGDTQEPDHLEDGTCYWNPVLDQDDTGHLIAWKSYVMTEELKNRSWVDYLVELSSDLPLSQSVANSGGRLADLYLLTVLAQGQATALQQLINQESILAVMQSTLEDCLSHFRQVQDEQEETEGEGEYEAPIEALVRQIQTALALAKDEIQISINFTDIPVETGGEEACRLLEIS